MQGASQTAAELGERFELSIAEIPTPESALFQQRRVVSVRRPTRATEHVILLSMTTTIGFPSGGRALTCIRDKTQWAVPPGVGRWSRKRACGSREEARPAPIQAYRLIKAPMTKQTAAT